METKAPRIFVGNWHVSERDARLVYNQSGRLVASVAAGLEHEAQLISAAPDLLALAQSLALRGHAEGCISRGRGYIASGSPTCDCLFGPAQAAIEKARGGR